MKNKNTRTELDLYEVVYRQYIDDLYDYSRSLGFNHDECLDAIHDVFYSIYTKKKSFALEKTKAYLFKSVKNQLFDYHNYQKRFVTKQTDYLFNLEFEISIQEDIIIREQQAELVENLNQLLSGLSPKQKEIIYLRYYQGMSYDEISKVMEITNESARKLLYRTLKILRSTPSFSLALLAYLYEISAINLY